jgi:hypothetical protein
MKFSLTGLLIFFTLAVAFILALDGRFATALALGIVSSVVPLFAKGRGSTPRR